MIVIKKQTQSQCCNSTTSTGSGFDILPRDVLLDVLIRLPISSLIQFRFVCRSCYAMSHDPELPRLHKAVVAKADPILVFHCDYPIRNQLSFVELRWIVYYRTPRRINPKTIGSYPRSEVHVLTIGESNSNNGWRCLGKVPYQLDRQAKEVVVVNGRLHWVSRPGRLGGLGGLTGRTIVSFDLKDEQFKLVSKPVNRSNYHLTVIDGCLAAAVSCGYGKLEIWVMKDYDVKESWMKRFDIHGAYLAKVPSHDYGIWRKAMHEKMVRVLCVLKNGEILMEYRGGSLVKYDPKWKEFKEICVSMACLIVPNNCTFEFVLNWTHNQLASH
ncbi:F-box protein-like protein [Tanacetum coccineum]